MQTFPILAPLVLLFALNSQAQTVASERISFEEAVDKALNLSYSVQRADFDLLSARADRLKTITLMGPTWQAGYTDTIFKQAQTYQADGFTIVTQPKQTQQTTLAIGINLTAILAGLMKLRPQNDQIELNEKTKQVAAIETAFGVAELYRLCQQAKDAVAVAQARLETTTKQQRDADSLFSFGKIAKADKLVIELNNNNAVLDLANAQNDRLNANLALKKVLHIESEGLLELDALKDLTMSMVPEIAKPSPAIAEALENREDLAASKLAVRVAERSRSLTLSPYIPIVTAGPNWQWNIANRDFYGADSYMQYFTINVSWNFWDNGASLVDLRKARINLQRAVVDQTEKTVDVRIDVEEALRKLELAKRTLQSRDLGLAQAKEVYRGFEARFAFGSVSVTELLFAENVLNTAKLDHLGATVGIDVAYMRMQKALGKKRPVPL